MNNKFFEIKYGTQNIILVMFGGLYQGLGIPRYEFANMTKDWDINRIYIKDIHKAWYSKGITNINENYLQTSYRITQELKKFPNCKKIFMGNSMGGYASILFGKLCKADKSIVFSPQTFIDVYTRAKYKDTRWEKYINKIDKNMRLNLKEFLFNYNIDIHYDKKFIYDKFHAENLKNSKNVRLFSYNFNSHELIRILKAKGLLVETILKSMGNCL